MRFHCPTLIHRISSPRKVGCSQLGGFIQEGTDKREVRSGRRLGKKTLKPVRVRVRVGAGLDKGEGEVRKIEKGCTLEKISGAGE